LLFSKIADEREFEHLALESFYNQHDPDHEKRQAHHHRYQPDEQMAEDWNEEQRESRNSKNGSSNHGRKAHPNTLKGMKPHKAVAFVRLDEQK
jgi:hypothetical protein